MRNDIFRKGLVVGIILLFVGTNIIPMINADTRLIDKKNSLFKGSIRNEINSKCEDECDLNISATCYPPLCDNFVIFNIVVCDKSGNYPSNSTIEIQVTFDSSWTLYYALSFDNGKASDKIDVDWPADLNTHNVTLTANPIWGFYQETNWTDNSIYFTLTGGYYHGILIGSFTNKTANNNVSTINTVQLLSISIFPPYIQIFSSNEKIIIVDNTYFGYFGPTSIAAAFFFLHPV
jgi:hypothetical protein